MNTIAIIATITLLSLTLFGCTSSGKRNTPMAAKKTLKDWLKLVVPVNSKLKPEGKAMVVRPVPANYKLSPYFVQKGDGFVFKVPQIGASTANSKSARCELTEAKHWSPKDGKSIFTIWRTVYELPKTNDGGQSRTCIGQVRGLGKEMVRLHFGEGDGDSAYLSVVDELRDPNPSFNNDSPIKLGKRFKTTITVTSKACEVVVTQGDQKWRARWTLDARWQKAIDCEFVLGNYNNGEKPGSGWSHSYVDSYSIKH